MAVYPQIPASRIDRKHLLEKELHKYNYKKFYCPALNVKVRVHPESITETAWHASKSVLSTKLALRLPYVIQNAKVYKEHITPKSTKQSKVFHFRELVILICGIRGLGTAKLTIGIKFKKMAIEYCITDFRYKK